MHWTYHKDKEESWRKNSVLVETNRLYDIFLILDTMLCQIFLISNEIKVMCKNKIEFFTLVYVTIKPVYPPKNFITLMEKYKRKLMIFIF